MERLATFPYDDLLSLYADRVVSYIARVNQTRVYIPKLYIGPT